MREVAEEEHQISGATVCCPRLAGHGGTPCRTLKERFLLINFTGALQPLMRKPILIMQSRCDNVVDPKTRCVSRPRSGQVRYV